MFFFKYSTGNYSFASQIYVFGIVRDNEQAFVIFEHERYNKASI